MKEKPILFSGPMVRAILDGRKTQTRRVVKSVVFDEHGDACVQTTDQFLAFPERFYDGLIQCPYGAKGDRLWVGETWRLGSPYESVSLSEFNYPENELSEHVHFAADDYAIGIPMAGQYRPSIYMPRWASRITLEITGVRVERLQEISEKDAIAEGTPDGGCLNCGNPNYPEPCLCENPLPDYRDTFIRLWSTIHAADGPNGWAANPFVWVIHFGRVVT